MHKRKHHSHHHHEGEHSPFVTAGFGGAGFGGPGFGGPRMRADFAFGPGGPGGPRGFGGRGRRMRRGNVRGAILLLLAEEPRNGYSLMQEIESRSDSAWRPSPGSMYPALQLLADEGLIRGEARDGGTVYELTDTGKAHLEEHRERIGVPWELADEGVPQGLRDLMKLAMQVGMATRQVAQAGTDTQREAAAKVLGDARRKLYGILAEDDVAE